jgi:hypothetical protein
MKYHAIRQQTLERAVCTDLNSAVATCTTGGRRQSAQCCMTNVSSTIA